MNILVCIKQVPSTNKVEVDPVTGVLKRNGIESKMNPYDLYALETALRLREERGGTITVITMGPPQAGQVLREAFSLGADDAVLLTDRKFGGADVLATSYALSQGIRKLGEFDLILCGKQTIDGDTAQVGPEIAEHLSIPSVSNVTKIIETTDESIVVEMDMPNDIEIARVQFPCLLAVEKDIFEPRLPSYRKKIASKDKEIKVFTFEDMEDKNEKRYGLHGSPTQVERIFPPATNDHQEIWQDNGNALADKLCAKLKELKFA